MAAKRLTATPVKNEPEVSDIRSERASTWEDEVYRIEEIYEETIGWLCLIVAGLAVWVQALMGFIEWDTLLQLFSICVMETGFLTFALIKFVTWRIEKKRKATE